jgi:hypothetical protein
MWILILVLVLVHPAWLECMILNGLAIWLALRVCRLGL